MHGIDDNNKSVTHNPFRFTGGVIILWKLKKFMNLTSPEKLIFIASFVWLMNWGVRVSESVITHLL